MPVELNDGAEIVKLEVYIQSIPRGEYRDLRLAAAKAEHDGTITWLADAAGRVTAAVVSAEFAARALQSVPLG
jgi:hypothetical protein